MKAYEMMMVLVPDFDHKDDKKTRQLIEKVLGDSVTIEKQEFWAKRTLAYPIRKFEEGIYILVHFSTDTLNLGQVQQRVKLNDTILRYLIVTRQDGSASGAGSKEKKDTAS